MAVDSTWMEQIPKAGNDIGKFTLPELHFTSPKYISYGTQITEGLVSDVFPFLTGDFLLQHVSFRGCTTSKEAHLLLGTIEPRQKLPTFDYTGSLIGILIGIAPYNWVTG